MYLRILKARCVSNIYFIVLFVVEKPKVYVLLNELVVVRY
jgi:DNA-binding protein Fis